MRIIEKGCDPSIKLAKFKFNCDECDKSIPNPLPQNLKLEIPLGREGKSRKQSPTAPAMSTVPTMCVVMECIRNVIDHLYKCLLLMH